MKSDTHAFASVADYYEVLFDSTTRLEREGPLLEQVYGQAPGNRVVDLACGTGVHALFFAERGAHVTALDASEGMITHAHSVRPHKQIAYRQGDMRSPAGGPWDLALCLGNSLCLLPSPEDAAQSFRATARQLAPGGLFLVQTLNYESPHAQQPAHKVITKQQGETEVVAVKSLVPHGAHTLLSLTFYAIRGDACTTVADTGVLLHLDLEDIKDLARNAGLSVENVWGGFDSSLFEQKASSNLIALFRKDS